MLKLSLSDATLPRLSVTVTCTVTPTVPEAAGTVKVAVAPVPRLPRDGPAVCTHV